MVLHFKRLCHFPIDTIQLVIDMKEFCLIVPSQACQVIIAIICNYIFAEIHFFCFENNKDGYYNIKKQTKMMNQAFEALQNKYNFNNFKGLGHSNGGLIYTAFIENYLSDYDVKINSLMTIGTPYNFTETNIKNKSVMLADFIAAKENIPTTLHVYSVAGTITYDSDELVPDASVSAGKYIYQNQAKSYTEITVTGEDAQHSDLPTNDEVVELIKQHIEGQGVRKKQKTNLEPQ